MNFRKKTDHSNRSNGHFLLGFIFPCIIFLTRATNSLATPWNLQSALTEGDRCRLPVAPCQSKQLTFLGIARWQTVVLLLSMLCIIMATVNLSFSSLSVLIVLLVVAAIFVAVHTDGQSKVSFRFQSCLLIGEYRIESAVY